MSTQQPLEDPYFKSKDPVRPIISDKAFLALMGTLKFIAVCVVVGLICWVKPEAIGWVCFAAVAMTLIVANPF